MLVYASRLIGTEVLSVQAGGPIAVISEPITDPDNLQIIAFKLSGPLISKTENYILDARSIREYSKYGFVIDDIDELVAPSDVVKIKNVLDLNFNLNTLKAETKSGHKLGKVTDYAVTTEDFLVQQILIKRPAIRGFLDPELIISRNKISEVTDYKIIIKEDKEPVKSAPREEKEFVPNFVNPFRKSEQGYAPAQTQNPDELDTE